MGHTTPSFVTKFRRRFSRPTALSDPYHDFSEEELNRLLAIPDAQLGVGDYVELLGPYLPAGTYEQTVYYLPRAFDCLISDDTAGFELARSVVWYCSHFVADLERDRVIADAREAITVCLQAWVGTFSFSSFDEVRHSHHVHETVASLIECAVHIDLAEHLYRSLIDQIDDAIRAAWLLGLARSLKEKGRVSSKPLTQRICNTKQPLIDAAGLVVATPALFDRHERYWDATFLWLNL